MSVECEGKFLTIKSGPFRHYAVITSLGVLTHTFPTRTLLVPSLIVKSRLIKNLAVKN